MHTIVKDISSFKNPLLKSTKGHIEARQDGLIILRTLAFLDAHRVAQVLLLSRLQPGTDGHENALLIIKESKDQIKLAFEVLELYEIHELKSMISYYAVGILLNKQALKIKELSNNGNFSCKEATEKLEHIQELLSKGHNCFAHVEHIDNEKDNYNGPENDSITRSVANVLNSIRTKPDPEAARRVSRASLGIHTKAEKFLVEEMRYFQDMKRRKKDIRKCSIKSSI